MVDGLWAGDSSLTKDFSTQLYRIQVGARCVRGAGWWPAEAAHAPRPATACYTPPQQQRCRRSSPLVDPAPPHPHSQTPVHPPPKLLGFNALRLPFSFKDFALPGRTDYNQCRQASLDEVRRSVTPPGVNAGGRPLPQPRAPLTAGGGRCNIGGGGRVGGLGRGGAPHRHAQQTMQRLHATGARQPGAHAASLSSDRHAPAGSLTARRTNACRRLPRHAQQCV